MTTELLCDSWPLQLPEPATPDPVARVQVQEEYLARHLGPWLRANGEAALAGLHSYHFMRYLDATHLSPLTGIILEFRILGPSPILDAAQAALDGELERQRSAGIVAAYFRKQRGAWHTSLIPAYGGPEMAEPFAAFLSAASKLTLELLKEPQHPFQSRSMVLDRWAHCFRLVTSCTG